MNHTHADSLLREVSRLFAQVQREGVACCGTTSTQCTLLTELGRNGPMTLADLGRRVGLDKGWISRAVEGLVQEGLLTKVPSADDRRTVIIDLSPAGHERFAELNRTLNQQAERVLARIPEAQRPGVVAAMELLKEALRAEAAGEPVLIQLEGDLK
ncbi:MAG TPA: MarR family transcriptional regulator [Symbiobacteriaceae bacterium]|nr:MarR family transcriptional regulator [Symbiobacteriaceae bacterium]